jgi:hypothetical protein
LRKDEQDFEKIVGCPASSAASKPRITAFTRSSAVGFVSQKGSDRLDRRRHYVQASVFASQPNSSKSFK